MASLEQSTSASDGDDQKATQLIPPLASTLSTAPAIPVVVPLSAPKASTNSQIASAAEALAGVAEISPNKRYIRFEEVLAQVGDSIQSSYRAFDTKNGIEVAWHTINLNALKESEQKQVTQCVNIVKKIQMKYIIEYLACWFGAETRTLNIITTHLDTLRDFMGKVTTLRWRIVKKWCRQILRGLDHLHSSSPPIVHRNVTCSHIFIDGGLGAANVGDIWMAAILTGDAASPIGLSDALTRDLAKVSPAHTAPEVLEGLGLSTKVDIYSFGMCVLEMLTREEPYKECNGSFSKIRQRVLAGRPPQALSRVTHPLAGAFLRACLLPEAERPSAAELLQHAFLVSLPGEDDDEVMLAPERPEFEPELPADDAPAGSLEREPTQAPAVGADNLASKDWPSTADGSHSAVEAVALSPVDAANITSAPRSRAPSGSGERLLGAGGLGVGQAQLTQAQAQMQAQSVEAAGGSGAASHGEARQAAPSGADELQQQRQKQKEKEKEQLDLEQELASELAHLEQGENVHHDKGVHEGRREEDEAGAEALSAARATRAAPASAPVSAPVPVPAPIPAPVTVPVPVSSASTASASAPASATASAPASATASATASAPPATITAAPAASSAPVPEHTIAAPNPTIRLLSRTVLSASEVHVDVKIPRALMKDGGPSKEVGFTFDLLRDKYSVVAAEMLEELGLTLSVEDLAGRLETLITRETDPMASSTAAGPSGAVAQAVISPRQQAGDSPVQSPPRPATLQGPDPLPLPVPLPPTAAAAAAAAATATSMAIATLHAASAPTGGSTAPTSVPLVTSSINSSNSNSSGSIADSTDSARAGAEGAADLQQADIPAAVGRDVEGVAPSLGHVLSPTPSAANTAAAAAATAAAPATNTTNTFTAGAAPAPLLAVEAADNLAASIEGRSGSSNAVHSMASTLDSSITQEAGAGDVRRGSIAHEGGEGSAGQGATAATATSGPGLGSAFVGGIAGAAVRGSGVVSGVDGKVSSDAPASPDVATTVAATLSIDKISSIQPSSSTNSISSSSSSSGGGDTYTSSEGLFHALAPLSLSQPKGTPSDPLGIAGASTHASPAQQPDATTTLGSAETLVPATAASGSLIGDSGLAASSTAVTAPPLTGKGSGTVAGAADPETSSGAPAPTSTSLSRPASSNNITLGGAEGEAPDAPGGSSAVAQEQAQAQAQALQSGLEAEYGALDEAATMREYEKLDKESRVSRRAFEQRIQKHKMIQEKCADDLLKLEQDFALKRAELVRKEESAVRRRDEELARLQGELDTRIQALKESLKQQHHSAVQVGGGQ